LPVELAVETLDLVAKFVRTASMEEYEVYEATARQRIEQRDEEDWPVLATALAYRAAIWTEDSDFFGCGVPTWTTDRVELFLRQPDQDNQPQTKKGQAKTPAPPKDFRL
jgi:hypothetical protein